MKRSERAQLAMILEVSAYPKPGNVDRCHDYTDTRLEHFLASAILSAPAFARAEEGDTRIGDIIRDAVARTNVHRGGNTHFGAFLLLVPLIAGGDIPGAARVALGTSVDDAVAFYEAFGLTKVRMDESDELDVRDPTVTEQLRSRGMTLFDVMHHSEPKDMIAREWVEGFPRTRHAADLLFSHGCGRESIVNTFIDLLATEPDTFIEKKHGSAVAASVMEAAEAVRNGTRSLADMDETCIKRGINPGSTADILIGGIFIALGEGWQWDC